MNNLNYAEKQFEIFCKDRQWKIYKIPELPGIQTPDFFVVANNKTFICEIKNLSKRGAERKDLTEFKNNGNIVGVGFDYNIETDSVVNKIEEANRQFKTTMSFNIPQTLIIYSDRFNPLDKEIVLRAMYGKVFQRLKIRTSKSVLKDSSSLPPLIVDRTLRKERNNLISSVAMPNSQNGILVLHNLWADIPLPIATFNMKDDINYIPEEISFKETKGDEV